MVVKYRVRLKNDRIVGPFSLEEIGELFLKEHIAGAEMCQHFPIGDWKLITEFPEITDLINQLKKENHTSIIKPEEILQAEVKQNKTGITKKELFEEFKFGKEGVVDIDIDYVELEKQYKSEQVSNEKTVIRKMPKMQASDNVDKTVIRKVDMAALRASSQNKEELEDGEQDIADILAANLKREQAQHHIVKLKSSVPEENESLKEVNAEDDQGQRSSKAKILSTEETQFINLNSVLPALNAELSASEVELELKAQMDDLKESKRVREIQELMLIEQAIEDGIDEEDIEVVEDKNTNNELSEPVIVVKSKKKKGMSIVALAAFLGVFYFFFFEDEKAPVDHSPKQVEINFPIIAASENSELANSNLVEARKLYANGTYISRALSTGHYLTSLQNKFNGNEALGEIILTYAELLDNTKDKYEAANTLFKYLQITESKLLSDPTIVTGTAWFYGKIGKFQTGIYIIKNYLRAGNKPTPKMLAYYLSLLVSAGEFVEAKNVYETLKNIPTKPMENYKAMAEFELANENLSQARTIIEEGLKLYSNSVMLLLIYADISLKEQSFKTLEKTLIKIESLGAERSPVYWAQFYKNMGYAAAYNKKNELASGFFNKSLAIEESEELRATLSSLDISGDKVSQNLILESKIIELVKKSKEQFKQGNIDSAFQYIIEAVDAKPDYIPAALFHAELSMYRGFFSSAIHSLQQLLGVHSKNVHIKKILIETYIKSFKFNDAENLLSELGQTLYLNTPDFAELMGDFMEAKGSRNLALKWYERALKRNPLDDSVMYKISKILVKAHKFQETRQMLSKAIMLDPTNKSYHALYSEILYEQDGADTAIGYLRDIISERGEDPELIGAITAYYFKSGQLKEFQKYYEKVQAMPKKNDALYELLIKSAELEGRKDEFIKHSKDLIKLNPGNLRARMHLGEIYFEEKKYDEAIKEFEEVKNSLDSYPSVHFQLAKVYIAKNDIDKALEMAKKELELNPLLSNSHYIMGEVHKIRGEYREAIHMYEKAISLNAKATEALISMADIRIKQNYGSEAIDLLNRALKDDISNPIVHKLLGDAYRAAGQRSMAREKYEDYLKLSPNASDKNIIDSYIRNLR